MILRGNVDGVHCRVDELEVREGGHVDAGAATVGLRNLVQLSLTRFTMFKCEVNQDLKISRRFFDICLTNQNFQSNRYLNSARDVSFTTFQFETAILLST